MKNILFVLFFCVSVFAQDNSYIPPSTSVTDRQFNFHFIDANVWRSSQPSPQSIKLLKEKYGLKSILNLRGSEEADSWEKSLADSLGINYIHFPMDARIPQSEDTLKTILKIVNSSENHPILVHCLGGKDRTGIVIALYKLEKYNTPKDELITEMLMYGQDAELYKDIIEALKNYNKQ